MEQSGMHHQQDKDRRERQERFGVPLLLLAILLNISLATAQSPANGAPVWQPLPNIRFENSSPDTQLALADYCSDPENDPISFSAQSQSPELIVQIDSLTSRVTFLAGRDLQGRSDVLFRARDSQGNTSAMVVEVWVDDVLPPRLALSYHRHLLLPDRVVFWVHADRTARQFSALIKSGQEETVLPFSQVGSDSLGAAWRAVYRFPHPGQFRLVARVTDVHQLSARDSLTILISNATKEEGR